MFKATTDQGETVEFYREPAYGSPAIAVIDCGDGNVIALTKMDGYVPLIDRAYIAELERYTRNYLSDQRDRNTLQREADRLLARINADAAYAASLEKDAS